MKPKFHIGQTVIQPAFTNYDGKISPEVKDLIVTEIRLISGQSIPDYYRIKAVRDKSPWSVEASERYFEAQSR